ncbi:alpha/beta hydrolase family protein [Sphingobacterium paludis]|uniref:Alpha-beta hydrolase superfamily lysophospholipase n=1 Tax=Sphingobacterium paludis TaxID=1476465 RepID=A0A4R7CZP3_9SPHI|nr:alpha/beta fold hydrolase [Sphingobacterium paludis]TDS13870.1 alpha-beta hydrolase superfamily lysophospholipase [Sphingobacterium paludis]
MMEKGIQFDNKGNTIYGIEHLPIAQNNHNNKMVIFLHGWSGYRTGPHDIFVKIARRLAQIGFGCVRFDFGGRGFSDGDQLTANFPSMLADLHTVIDDITKRAYIHDIILVGMCSGARLGLYYIKYMTYGKISHLIEISSPPLNETEDNTKMEVRKFNNSLKGYFNKAFDRGTYKKFRDGEINYRHIFKILISPFLNVAKKNDLKVVQAKRWEEKGTKYFKGAVLSIHGGKDPETALAVVQIENMLEENEIAMEKHIIEDGNHSFYSIYWEKEIIDLIEGWLLKPSKS